MHSIVVVRQYLDSGSQVAQPGGHVGIASLQKVDTANVAFLPWMRYQRGNDIGKARPQVWDVHFCALELGRPGDDHAMTML